MIFPWQCCWNCSLSINFPFLVRFHHVIGVPSNFVGERREAFVLFSKMRKEGIKPGTVGEFAILDIHNDICDAFG